MSRHKSLGKSNKTGAKKNVLKRFERVDLMKERGIWKERKRVTNLPKIKPE
jgi:small basic protein (TIGR04137 family)